MSSSFARAAQSASLELDHCFAERLEIRHVLDGQFITNANNPDVPAFIVLGILDLPDVIAGGIGGSEITRSTSTLAVTDPRADFRLMVFDQDHLAPKRGSLIIAIDRQGAPRFQVRDALSDGLCRIVCQLKALD